jgi:hypothetical protein
MYQHTTIMVGLASMWVFRMVSFFVAFFNFYTLLLHMCLFSTFFTGSNLKKIALHYNVSLYNTSSARSWAYCAARIRAKVGQDNE